MPRKLYKIRNKDQFSRLKYAYVMDDYDAQRVVRFVSDRGPSDRARLFKVAEEMGTENLNVAYRAYMERSGDNEDGDLSEASEVEEE